MQIDTIKDLHDALVDLPAFRGADWQDKIMVQVTPDVGYYIQEVKRSEAGKTVIILEEDCEDEYKEIIVAIKEAKEAIENLEEDAEFDAEEILDKLDEILAQFE